MKEICKEEVSFTLIRVINVLTNELFYILTFSCLLMAV